MRGIPSLITDIRKNVFTEVAKMAYEGGDYSKVEDLPYIIVPGDSPCTVSPFSLREPLPASAFALPWDFPCALSSPVP